MPGRTIESLPVLLTDPVVLQDGILHLRLGNERDGPQPSAPLLSATNEPFSSFVPGWTPILLYSGLAPFRILEFRNQDGARASWLLDASLRRLGDKLADLDAGQAAALRDQLVPLLRRIVTDILLRPMPVLSREAQAFVQVNEILRTALSEIDSAAVLPVPQALLIDEIPETIPFAGAFSGNAPQVMLSLVHLRAGLEVPFEDRLVAATRDGMLHWPSPIDGHPLRCQGCFYFDDFRFAYRFCDITVGLTFYVIAADHYCKAMAVYIPSIDLLVVRDAWCRHLLDVYFPPNLTRWFINQAALHGPLLVPYLVRGARRIASVMRGQPGTHLGHQLWNELSGIEYLLTAAQGDQIPEWIIPGAAEGIELWGPIEALFPELRQRVNRDIQHGGDMMAHVYREGICAVRVTRERVSAELRRRLQRITQTDPAHGDIRRQVEAARRRGAPVIILGLRVENRTLVDISAFFRDAIRLVAQLWPGAILVIDGHNTRDGGQTGGNNAEGDTVIRSHGEALAARSPLQTERDIAAELRATSEGLDVTLLDTLGASMACSLSWALLCDGFLSVWGASLAKFRWVSNKPGLVVSSQANLLHRDDLHIYDDPRYMETPTRLLFADPAAVVDDPDAPRLVPVGIGNPFFANFRVDHGRVLAQFRVMLDEVMGKAGGPAP